MHGQQNIKKRKGIYVFWGVHFVTVGCHTMQFHLTLTTEALYSCEAVVSISKITWCPHLEENNSRPGEHNVAQPQNYTLIGTRQCHLVKCGVSSVLIGYVATICDHTQWKRMK
jgi:hypothetical protein